MLTIIVKSVEDRIVVALSIDGAEPIIFGATDEDALETLKRYTNAQGFKIKAKIESMEPLYSEDEN